MPFFCGFVEMACVRFAKRNVQHALNLNEVSAVRYVSPEEMRRFFAEPGIRFTPWFRLIVENFIYKWWDALQGGTLQQHIDVETIHKP